MHFGGGTVCPIAGQVSRDIWAGDTEAISMVSLGLGMFTLLNVFQQPYGRGKY